MQFTPPPLHLLMLLSKKGMVKNDSLENIGLVQLKDKDVNNFTTNAGIRIRRMIYPAVKLILKITNPDIYKKYYHLF